MNVFTISRQRICPKWELLTLGNWHEPTPSCKHSIQSIQGQEEPRGGQALLPYPVGNVIVSS